ncbi:NADPH-dependent FMN reductase [Spirochaeta dissipatitropha]
MKIMVLSGSVAGNKTRAAAVYAVNRLLEHNSEHEARLLDLAEYSLEYSDGRNYLDYSGDTGHVVREIMAADILIVASPIFQASMPGALKNVLDLLPTDALRDKIVALIVTAGSQRHNFIPETMFKPIFGYLKAHMVESYVFIEDRDFQNSQIANDDVFFRIQRLIEDALTLADVYAAVRNIKDEAYGF